MNQQVLEAKQSVVKEIVDKAQKAQSLTIVEYRGLTVADLQTLRRALREEGAEICVYKNSLAERAAKELKAESLGNYLTGPNALVFSTEMAKGPKVLAKYAKRFGESLKIKGGFVEGQTLNQTDMLEIAKMPNREGLISMFLSCLQAPIRQFACIVKAMADSK